MKDFFKSIWFILIIFVVLELIAFGIGYTRPAMVFCSLMPCIANDCPKCPSISSLHMQYGTTGLIIGFIPSIIISLIIYFIIKKYNK